MESIACAKSIGVGLDMMRLIHPNKMKVHEDLTREVRAHYSKEEVHQEKFDFDNKFLLKLVYAYEDSGMYIVVHGIKWFNFLSNILVSTDESFSECKKIAEGHIHNMNGVAVMLINKPESLKEIILTRRLISDRDIIYIEDVVNGYSNFRDYEWPLYKRNNNIRCPYYIRRKELSLAGSLIGRDDLAAKLLKFPYSGQSLLSLYENVQELYKIIGGEDKKLAKKVEKDLDKLLTRKVAGGGLKISGIMKKYKDEIKNDEKGEDECSEDDENDSDEGSDEGSGEGSDDGIMGDESEGDESECSEGDESDGEDDKVEDEDNNTSSSGQLDGGDDKSDDDEYAEFPRLRQIKDIFDCELLHAFIKEVRSENDNGYDYVELVSQMRNFLMLQGSFTREEDLKIDEIIGGL